MNLAARRHLPDPLGLDEATPVRVRRAAPPARAPGTVRQLYRLLVDGGRWWLVPMIGVLGVTALILAVVTAIEYVAPFVYTIF
jgi:hypothetical protein